MVVRCGWLVGVVVSCAKASYSIIGEMENDLNTCRKMVEIRLG